MKYTRVVCGGTFDRLHEGHKDFLNFALSLGEKAVIGLTSDAYIEKYKKGRGIEPFDVRKKSLENYLESIDRRDRVEIIPIDDPYGPTITGKYPFDALAVTEVTLGTGREINKRRIELGFFPLPLEVFRLTLGERGEPISSSKIRENLLLPTLLRQQLHEALGEVLSEIPSRLEVSKIITVGDVTTQKFFEKKLEPRLAIIDFRVDRKPIEKTEFTYERIVRVKNPAGTVTVELFEAIEKALQGNTRTIIIVDGEEDLSVLPALVSAPLGFTIFYGQPHEGLVKVPVTEDAQEKARKLLSRFEVKS